MRHDAARTVAGRSRSNPGRRGNEGKAFPSLPYLTVPDPTRPYLALHDYTIPDPKIYFRGFFERISFITFRMISFPEAAVVGGSVGPSSSQSILLGSS